MPEQHIEIGVAWYRREQWSLLLSLIPDPKSFPNTYDEWSARASETLRQLDKEGVAAQKVDVEVTALIRWAESLGRVPNGDARAEYASHLLRKSHEKKSS